LRLGEKAKALVELARKGVDSLKDCHLLPMRFFVSKTVLEHRLVYKVGCEFTRRVAV